MGSIRSLKQRSLLGSQGEPLGLLLSYHRLTQGEQPCTQDGICSCKPKNGFRMSKGPRIKHGTHKTILSKGNNPGQSRKWFLKLSIPSKGFFYIGNNTGECTKTDFNKSCNVFQWSYFLVLPQCFLKTFIPCEHVRHINKQSE